MNQQVLDSTIYTVPSYSTRQQDEVDLPEARIFTDAYKLVSPQALTSKMKEPTFQILNRTIWTNSKAFKSGRRLEPNFDRCGNPESMECLLYECGHYYG
jgi:hypothetical protein